MAKSLVNRFFDGTCYDAWQYFGAHPYKKGYIFRVFAPHAVKIFVIGEFNDFKGMEMAKTDDRGIFELYVEGVREYQSYKYKILTKDNTALYKKDPFGFYSELRPGTDSKTADLSSFGFTDDEWLSKRNKCENEALNIFEVHLGSFLKHEDNTWYSYEEIAKPLISYVKKHHFTHVEIMPLMEHPFDGSWGYQCSSYFSITSRYGNPSQLKYLINELHRNGIGVITDFVPTHFVKDDSALGMFDGRPLYESDDESLQCSQWNTYLFDYSKPHVRSFVLSCAHFYLDEYHFDGIRFDAVSNMIYKDGNSNNKEQMPNISWMKMANEKLSKLFPTALLIAEDSSAYGKVTGKVKEKGLGFDYKWDLGWMNDTLEYFKIDPYFRGDNLNKINFSMFYFYSEKFMLPLSHDEVVHMKGSMLNKMNGTYEMKFQQLKALYTYMYTHPGKKLNFMGNELAMWDEWNEDRQIDYSILNYPIHDGFHKCFTKLCEIYQKEKVLHTDEYNPLLFRWVQCDNKDNIFIFERFYKRSSILTVLNFSNTQYEHYKFRVSKKKGYYKEIFNSDDYAFAGHGYLNDYRMNIDENQSVGIRIPSFGALILKYKNR